MSCPPTIRVDLTSECNFAEWRVKARRLLQNNVNPVHTVWRGPSTAPSLLDPGYVSWDTLHEKPQYISVPSRFPDVAERVICHRDPERFSKLYDILFRLRYEKGLLDKTTDEAVTWLTDCDNAIRRDRHKMHAFVRFRKIGETRFRKEQFAAWFEPDHFIVELATPFFVRRFPNMDWIIVTPDCTAIWDGAELDFGPGGQKSDVPKDDAVEEQWKTYFSAIFNPARLKVGAMMSEMPKKYWHNMPETDLIPDLIAGAQIRQADMQENAVTPPNPLAEKLSLLSSSNQSKTQDSGK